jgi:hypothetical protein
VKDLILVLCLQFWNQEDNLAFSSSSATHLACNSLLMVINDM